MIKEMRSFKSIFTVGFILVFSVIASNMDNALAEDPDPGYWAQADRYDRFPCAGPPTDCYVLPTIIVESD